MDNVRLLRLAAAILWAAGASDVNMQGLAPSPSKGLVLSPSKGPVLSHSKGPALSQSKGPALSPSKGPALSPPKGPPQPEIVHIDGSKNPELIPAWSAWGYAFRVFAGGPRELPSSLLQHVSKAEEALLMAESDAVQRFDARCQERLGKIVARRGAEKLQVLDRQMHALSVECRRETLRARDRVLAGLNAEARAALNAFVESTKAGTSVSIPRSQLARFREPE